MGRGKRGVVVPAATVVAAACVAAFVFYATTRRPAIQPEAGPSPSPIRTVVLITIDTLRADRVGAYGWTAARTPAIDALAARGVRFARAFATAPITLPSHASLLTGLYPPGHGSRHNGMKVSAESATLAMVLREQGWATGAFVGAFPLDRRFGLDRGFDQYGDRMPRGPDGRLLNEGREARSSTRRWRGLAASETSQLFYGCISSSRTRPTTRTLRAGPADVICRPSIRYNDEVARADVDWDACWRAWASGRRRRWSSWPAITARRSASTARSRTASSSTIRRSGCRSSSRAPASPPNSPTPTCRSWTCCRPSWPRWACRRATWTASACCRS